MFQVTSPTIVHETIDNETVIINTVNGLYYIAADHASVIWNALMAGHGVPAIAAAFTHAGLFTDEEGLFEKFIALLIAEGLITPVPDPPVSATAPISIIADLGLKIPVLTKHDDLHELIELDPIHEVSPDIGWPFQETRDHDAPA